MACFRRLFPCHSCTSSSDSDLSVISEPLQPAENGELDESVAYPEVGMSNRSQGEQVNTSLLTNMRDQVASIGSHRSPSPQENNEEERSNPDVDRAVEQEDDISAQEKLERLTYVNKILADHNKKLTKENKRLRAVNGQSLVNVDPVKSGLGWKSDELEILENSETKNCDWKKKHDILQFRSEKVANFNATLLERIYHLKEEEKKLREDNIELDKKNFELKKKNIELEKTIKDTKTENVDGAVNSPQGEECVSSNGQTVILPSVSQEWKPHPRYFRPSNCLTSCVMCTIVYVILEITGKIMCRTKFPREIQRRLDYASIELRKKMEGMGIHMDENQDDQEGNKNKEQKEIICHETLRDLMDVGLVVSDKLYPSPPIKNIHELDYHIREATNAMRENDSRWAIFCVKYQKESEVRPHAMAIRLFEDKSNPTVCAAVYDAQTRKLWPQSDKHAESVIQFDVYGIDERVAKKFAEKCRVEHCKEEFLAATRSGEATGVAHLCDPGQSLALDFHQWQ